MNYIAEHRSEWLADGVAEYRSEWLEDEWGYGHKTACHARGEYARDDDGDGFCEVHVDTAEGLWSLLRSWLRPHRGVSQKELPLYLGFSSSSTTPAAGARLCSPPSSRAWSGRPTLTTPKPDKSRECFHAPTRCNCQGDATRNATRSRISVGGPGSRQGRVRRWSRVTRPGPA